MCHILFHRSVLRCGAPGRRRALRAEELGPLALALLLSTVVCASAQTVNRVENGSFEQPAVPTGAYQVFAWLPGWSQFAGFSGIEVQHRTAGSPFEGNQFVELDSFTPTGITQDVPTLPGASYTVQFAFSPRPGTPQSDNILRVTWDGAEVALLSASGIGLSDTRWTVHTFAVVGSLSSTTRLTFEDLGTPNTLGTYLDDVQVIERDVPPGIDRIQPNTGGNTGSATVHIFGAGFQPGARVVLTRTGEADITAARTAVLHGGATIAATFDLTGSTIGLRDVVVENPNGPPLILQGAFSIDEGIAAEVWVDIVGGSVFRPGRPLSFLVFYGNRGNVDAVGVPLWIRGLPADARVDLRFDVLAPVPSGDDPADISAVPTSIVSDNERLVPMLIPAIPGNTTAALSFTVTLPAAQPVRLAATIERPWFCSSGNDDAADCLSFWLTAGAGLDPSIGDCARAFLNAYGQFLASLVFEIPIKPINLFWAALNIGFQCGDVPGCALCTGGLTPSCVVCAAGMILDKTADMVNVWLAGEACGRSAGEFALDLLPVTSYDPNDKTGSRGTGPLQYVSGLETIRYAVSFENLENATAAAQEVSIVDVLDREKLDLGTFALGPIAFGEWLITPPPGARDFTHLVDLRPKRHLLVRIEASLDAGTGTVTWRFVSLDPTTGQPPTDPLAGFLPPNIDPPAGAGSVAFAVMPQRHLPTGASILNAASIVFDTNTPIRTRQWLNTIDATVPSSAVFPLPAIQSSQLIDVSWAGTDGESGVWDFTILVSENGGPFLVWLENTTATNAQFLGAPGRTYAFYSLARDRVGNVETRKTTSDASTTVGVDGTPPTITITTDPSVIWPPDGRWVSVAVAGRVTDDLSGIDPDSLSFRVLDEYGAFQGLSGPFALSEGGAFSFPIRLQARRTGRDRDGRQYELIVIARDRAGNERSASASVLVPHDMRK